MKWLSYFSGVLNWAVENGHLEPIQPKQRADCRCELVLLPRIGANQNRLASVLIRKQRDSLFCAFLQVLKAGDVALALFLTPCDWCARRLVSAREGLGSYRRTAFSRQNRSGTF